MSAMLKDGYIMINNTILERYFDFLLQGDRKKCREVIEDALKTGIPANTVYTQIIWPIMVEIEKLTRADQLNIASEHMAVRINRTIVDQLQNKLPRKESKCKKIVVSCALEEIQELGAQIMADLFESDGWEVKFIGGGITNDVLLAFVNDYVPDILLIYGTAAKQAPQIRQLIDTIKDINAYPEMKIMVSGGLFNRAEGLWQEIGADLFASEPRQALEVAINENNVHIETERVLNRRKRRKLQKTV